MQTKPFFLAVGALIDNGKGACLLLKRSELSTFFPGAWETPGGKSDEGESFTEALMREVREEAGLEISLDGLVGASEFELPEKKSEGKPGKKIVLLYMKAHVVSGQVTLSDEHQDFAWLPFSKFRTKSLTPALASLVEKLKIEETSHICSQ